MIFKVGISVEEALRMATSNPAKLMGLDGSVGELRAGAPASMLLIEPDFTSVEVI